MAAPTPSAFWERARPDQLARASGLIAEHLTQARDYARWISHRYPGEDVEPRIMMGLYKAAYSWNPGTAKFYWWFKRKARGELWMLTKRRNTRDEQGIHIHRLERPWVDSRFSYRQDHV